MVYWKLDVKGSVNKLDWRITAFCNCIFNFQIQILEKKSNEFLPEARD